MPMKSILTLLLLLTTAAQAEIGLITPAEARALIEQPDASTRSEERRVGRV